MSIFLDPRGRPTYGIGICARCSRKFFLDQLSPDPNSPGLMVCKDDLDELDPYRLPPRQTDNITLPFYRPDSVLSIEGPDPFTLADVPLRLTEDNDLREIQIDNDLREAS